MVLIGTSSWKYLPEAHQKAENMGPIHKSELHAKTFVVNSGMVEACTASASLSPAAMQGAFRSSDGFQLGSFKTLLLGGLDVFHRSLRVTAPKIPFKAFLLLVLQRNLGHQKRKTVEDSGLGAQVSVRILSRDSREFWGSSHSKQ